MRLLPEDTVPLISLRWMLMDAPPMTTSLNPVAESSEIMPSSRVPSFFVTA